MGSGIDKEELRQLVRDVLRSSLPGGRPRQPLRKSRAISSRRSGRRCCRAESACRQRSADLDAFAREIVNAAAHEDLKAAIMTGRVTFSRKDDGPGQAQNRAPAMKGGQFRIDKGHAE